MIFKIAEATFLCRRSRSSRVNRIPSATPLSVTPNRIRPPLLLRNPMRYFGSCFSIALQGLLEVTDLNSRVSDSSSLSFSMSLNDNGLNCDRYLSYSSEIGCASGA
ncbi:hypothetical protein D3C80_1078980 [compost metagenome]